MTGAGLGLRGLVRMPVLPEGFQPPDSMSYEGIRAHVLTRDDLDDDVRGINSSLELIRRTRGRGWPMGPVTVDDDFVDLVWHEAEFRNGYSYSYALRDAAGGYLGCCYLYPVGRRVPLTDELLAHDIDVSWWVTEDAHRAGYYAIACAALHHWARVDFPFEAPYFSNVEIPEAGG